MLITDRFVYIHVPKTGGTFVSTMLKQIHGLRNTEPAFLKFLARRLGIGRHGLLDTNKHGTCAQIPRRHTGKTIVTSIRNPYDRYVSQYEFKWWLKKPDFFGNPSTVKTRFPSFPNLSFAEYVALTNTVFTLPVDNDGERLGWHTTQFIKWFSRDHERVHRRVDRAYPVSEAYRQDFFPVRFLRTSRLNADLHDFLIEMGYPPDRVAPILGSGKIFPLEGGRDANQSWEKYFTPELKEFVRTREWMLFELFPEFDV